MSISATDSSRAIDTECESELNNTPDDTDYTREVPFGGFVRATSVPTLAESIWSEQINYVEDLLPVANTGSTYRVSTDAFPILPVQELGPALTGSSNVCRMRAYMGAVEQSPLIHDVVSKVKTRLDDADFQHRLLYAIASSLKQHEDENRRASNFNDLNVNLFLNGSLEARWR